MLSKGSEDHDLVTILSTGSTVNYTVPSFPVFNAVLREIKFQFVSDTDDNTSYDGYIRECPDLVRPYPALVKLCIGYTNGFGIDPEEFNLSVSTDSKTFYEGLVFVIWKAWTKHPITKITSEMDSLTPN